MMGIESINEPGNSRQSFSPPSINEPPSVDDINAPRATGMEPATIVLGDPDTTLHVTGLNFTPDTFIVFNEVPMASTYVSETELTGLLSTGALEVRDYPVTVGLGPFVASPAMMFSVTEPAGADPDVLEEEIEAALADDEFKPLHRGRASHTLPSKRKR